MNIKIKTIAYIAEIELPAMEYTAVMQALNYAVKNKFTQNKDILWSAEEVLKYMQKVDKTLN